MATCSSTLAWKIPWMEEPGKLQSMGSLRVRHDWVTSLSLFTFMHWRRKWQPTPVFLLGESQGQRSLVGCHLWGRTELDTTEATYSSSNNMEGYIAVNKIYLFQYWEDSFSNVIKDLIKTIRITGNYFVKTQNLCFPGWVSKRQQNKNKKLSTSFNQRK